MADKKSIIEEALLDITNIQNALNANTKEILRSVAKEEINGVVKESLIDEVYEEEELELEPAEMGGEEEEESDDVEYEIEMGDDEEENEIPDDLVPADEEGEEEEEVEDDEDVEALEEKISVGIGMSQGTHRNKTGAGSIGASENPKSVNESLKAKQLVSETTKKYNTLLTEAKKLKTENEEFRSALREFRTKLVETVVFNSNLTYVTKLFLEHSTTKAEKDVIIKRFDEASNLKESKKLYKTIGGELESRKPINESIESKIIKEASTSTSKQLNESTAYVDPSTKRIMDLINRVEKR